MLQYYITSVDFVRCSIEYNNLRVAHSKLRMWAKMQVGNPCLVAVKKLQNSVPEDLHEDHPGMSHIRMKDAYSKELFLVTRS